MIAPNPQPEPDHNTLPDLSKVTLDTPLTTFLYECYVPLQLIGCSPNTTRQYEIQLRHLGSFLGRAATLRDLTDEQMSAFMENFARDHREPTVNKARSHMFAIWRFASKRGIVRGWPTVKALKESVRAPQAWTIEQMEAIMRASQEMPGWINGVRSREWWPALLRIMWDSGERISAVMHLKWSDIDLSESWITIRAETRKGRTADMVHRLRSSTVASLKAIQHPPRELVFEWPWTYPHLFQRFGKLLKRAGLPDGRRDKFHRIRRSVASHAEAAGGNATTILGHSSRRVTELYLDPRVVQRPQCCDVLPDLDKPKDVDNEWGQGLLLATLVDEFRQHLIATGTCRAEFADEHMWRLKQTIEQVQIDTVAQLNGKRINTWLLRRQAKGELSETTTRHYRQAVARFCRWLGNHKGIYGSAVECADVMALCQTKLGDRTLAYFETFKSEGGAA